MRTQTFPQPAPQGSDLEPQAPHTLHMLRSKARTGTGWFFWTLTPGQLPQMEVPEDSTGYRSLP